MPTHPIELPDAVQGKAAAYGQVGLDWVAGLPAVADELARRWDLALGATMSGGTEAYVAEAVLADGTLAVLKVAMPAEIDGADTFAHSVIALQLADGRGCVRLLAHDVEHRAILVERLGPTLASLGQPIDVRLRITSSVAAQMWVPVPERVELPWGDWKARWLADAIVRWWEDLDHPCTDRVVDLALAYAESRSAAFDRDRSVLVHGDAHWWNTLRAPGGAFRLVDPEGLISEPAHDLGIPMRELRLDDLGPDLLEGGRAKARYLAHLHGIDAEAVWQWGYVERVSTGLYSLTLGQEAGHGFLTIAERWAEELGPAR